MEITETQRILAFLRRSYRAPMSVAEIVAEEIRLFTGSEQYRQMREAEKYYLNRSDVQNKTNEIAKRSNTKLERPVLKKLIDQKTNYTFTRPFSIGGDNKQYNKALNNIFNDQMRQRVKRFGRGAPRMGKGWMLPYISDKGMLDFRVIPATNIIPFWADEGHTEIQGFLYFYSIIEYDGYVAKSITKAEWWDDTGVMYFTNASGSFQGDPERQGKYPHFTVDGEPFNWKIPPIVWCKYNDEELPLQYFLKELIDDLNWQNSITADVLRDVAKFIWVIKNYGGAEMSEFVDELRKYLAIKVESDGGVDTIQPEPKIEAVLAFIDNTRRDIYDLGSGVDTKDPELGSASGKAMYFRYMDLDTDSANIQSEMKVAFLKLKPFLDDYFNLTGQGQFYDYDFGVTFNTDMPVDEPEIFQNATLAKNIGVSLRTILDNLPWIKDVDDELDRIAEEQEEIRRRNERDISDMAHFNFPLDGETE